MKTKLKFFLIILGIFTFTLSYLFASAPLFKEYKFLSEKKVYIDTKLILDKSVGDDIYIIYDDITMECKIKRYNDFYGARQFRCYVPCIPFFDDDNTNCINISDRESNYFVVTANLENPFIIGSYFYYQDMAYYILTRNEKGEELEPFEKPEVSENYHYFLTKNKLIINTPIEVLPINNQIMYNNLKGKILLQVENAGEAYYIHPNKTEMYYLGRPDDAFSIMREQGIGITNSDLDKIPVSLDYLSGKDSNNDGLPDAFKVALGLDVDKTDTDGDGFDDYTELLHGYDPLGPGKINHDLDFSKAQGGRILLQVERNGEAWYVNPKNNKRYFLGRPNDAFEIMRNLGLGISNKDLSNLGLNSELNANNNLEFSCGDSVQFMYGGETAVYGSIIGQNNTC